MERDKDTIFIEPVDLETLYNSIVAGTNLQSLSQDQVRRLSDEGAVRRTFLRAEKLARKQFKDIAGTWPEPVSQRQREQRWLIKYEPKQAEAIIESFKQLLTQDTVELKRVRRLTSKVEK